jgi:SAM-dependent methyltransferase
MFSKFLSNPLGFLRRAFWKFVIGPFKYRKNGRFDAERYWRDRYTRYGSSEQGAGEEGLSEAENQRRHEEAAQILVQLCRQEGIDLPRVRLLEVGCGSGFYAGFFRRLGVKSFVGTDITDVPLARLREAYPDFQFHKKDITADPVEGEYDLVLMIYVVIHIMDKEKLARAMGHVRQCLSAGGRFLIGPLAGKSERKFFYLRSWSVDDIREQFPGYLFGEPVPFQEGYALVIRKPSATDEHR